MSPVAVLLLGILVTVCLLLVGPLLRAAWAMLVLVASLAAAAACIILPLWALSWLLH